MARKRKISVTSIDAMEGHREVQFDSDHNGVGVVKVATTIKAFFESITGTASDPTNTVINGATTQSKPLLAKVLTDIASQVPRLGEDISLIHSLADTTLLDGGIVDDRQYQVCYSRSMCPN